MTSSRSSKDRRVAQRKENRSKKRKPLEEEEMFLILEEIARNASNQSARIAAIRQLREMNREDDGHHEAEPQGFDALDNVTPIRKAAAG